MYEYLARAYTESYELFEFMHLNTKLSMYKLVPVYATNNITLLYAVL